MKTRMLSTLLKVGLCTAACFSPAAHTSTLNHGFEGYRVATADELDEMRGGFDLNFGGLHLSFSIDRVTFINGVLVATTSLNIPSLNSLDARQTIADSVNQQAIIARLQNAAGNSSVNPVTAVPNNSPQNTSSLPSAPNLPTTTPTTVVQNTTGSSYNPINAVQNGTRNSFILPEGINLSTSALTTVIQNTLDNQVIRNMTILNATLNSQALARAMAISSSLNQMLNSSAR